MKPQTLKGFRDFLPEDATKRQYIRDKVVGVFTRFGFDPIETPTLEYADVILGKYGDEADKLVYSFKDRGDRGIALRYDQTIPTARLLAQYSQSLPKYFRRYQIQNVFRAEKPQKGRFREFTQCDFDVFGSTSPIADAEILACSYFTFEAIGYPDIRIRVNDRAILFDVLEKFASEKTPVLSIIQTIDKLDKIAEEGVVEELIKKGFKRNQAEDALTQTQKSKPTTSLESILSHTQSLGVPEEVLQFDPTLARGLDYYTGMIFEISVGDGDLGSLGGGGRYDNLIGQLGGLDIPAVGVGLGFDRMVEVADQLNLLPSSTTNAQVLVTVFDETSTAGAATIASTLRNAGVQAELYPAVDKLDKQLKYADRKGIPYAVIQGPDEKKDAVVQLKDLHKKKQESLSLDDVIQTLTNDQ